MVLQLSPDSLVDTLSQVETKAIDLANKVNQKRKDDDEFDLKAKLVAGLVLCFLGGQFQTTFAFAEAFYQTGWSTLTQNLDMLSKQVKHARAALQADAAETSTTTTNTDNDESNKWKRQVIVAYNAMDPDIVKRALGQLALALAAAVTTVQLKFARVLGLGNTLGDFFREHVVERFLLTEIYNRVPRELHKWVPMLVEYVSRLVFMAIAFRLTNFFITVSSAVRGGGMILESVNSLCAKRGIEFLTQGPADEVMTMGLVVFGVLAQSLAGKTTRTVFNLVCFPLAFTEQLLHWIVVLKASSNPV